MHLCYQSCHGYTVDLQTCFSNFCFWKKCPARIKDTKPFQELCRDDMYMKKIFI